jgi:hypothetical protein
VVVRPPPLSFDRWAVCNSAVVMLMEMTVRRIMLALVAVVGLGILTSIITSTTPYDPAKQGGDRKQIAVQADTEPTETVVLERPIGIRGTKFVVVVQVEGDTATLAKGYIKGSTGANFTVAGQSLGFGVSNPEFWIEKVVRGAGMSEDRVFACLSIIAESTSLSSMNNRLLW